MLKVGWPRRDKINGAFYSESEDKVEEGTPGASGDTEQVLGTAAIDSGTPSVLTSSLLIPLDSSVCDGVEVKVETDAEAAENIVPGC